MSRKQMPRDVRPLPNRYERRAQQHPIPNDAPHQAVLEADTLKSDASTWEKIAIGAAALSLALSMTVLGAPGELPPAHATIEQTA